MKTRKYVDLYLSDRSLRISCTSLRLPLECQPCNGLHALVIELGQRRNCSSDDARQRFHHTADHLPYLDKGKFTVFCEPRQKGGGKIEGGITPLLISELIHVEIFSVNIWFLKI